METDEFKSSKTRKLRLKPFDPSELPANPALSSIQDNAKQPVELKHFMLETLTEAAVFTDSIIPTTFQKKGSPKSSGPSTAKVQLLSSDLISGEAWFARQSEHENTPTNGTASYTEFENGLFHQHSVNEADYTPDVYDCHKICDWSEEINRLGDDLGTQFEQVALELYEMCHHIASPLDNRIFATLVVRGKITPESFVVAQIPVDLSKIPTALYSNGRHRTEGDSARKKEKVTVGQYVSVERVRLLENGHIFWEMATASDAKGMLPMSLQKMGVPGAVVKDVGFFMKWSADRRKVTT